MSDNIDIVIRDSGVEVVVRDLRQVGQSARESSGDVDVLKSALSALTAALTVDKILEYADAWNSLAGLVRVTTDNTNQAAAVTNLLYNAAQKTRQPIDAMAQLYNRAALQAQELGASQNDLVKFVTEVGESLAIQHTSTARASGALLQLSEIMGTGVVKAQQYNSVLRGLPVVLQVVAKNMDGTGGTVAGLTAKVKSAGKVTSEEFFQALLKGAPQLDETFQKTSFLFSQSFTIMNNAITKWIGEWNEAFGASNAFASFANYFSQHADSILSLLTAIGVAVAVAFAPALILRFVTLLQGAFTLLLANPFTALIAAVAGLIAYVGLYGDKINAGIDKTTTLKDVGLAAVDELKQAWQGFVTWFPTAWATVVQVVLGDTGVIASTNSQTAQDLSKTYSDFFETNRTGWAAFLTNAAKVIDAIAGLLTGLGIAIFRIFSGLPDLVVSIFETMYNDVVEWVQKIENKAIDMSNALRSKVGLFTFKHLDFSGIEFSNVDKTPFETYGKNIAASINDGYDVQGGFAQHLVDDLLSKAQKISKAEQAALKPPQDPGLGVHPATPAALPDTKGLNKLKNELRSVLEEISPMQSAIEHLAKAEQILDAAVKAGLISKEQEAKYLKELHDRYQDQLDPIGAVTRKLNEEASTYQHVGDMQAAYAKLIPILEDLKKKNVDVTNEETQAYLKQILALQQLQRVNEIQNQILNQTVYAQRQVLETATAIQKLQTLGTAKGGINAGQAAQATNSALGGLGFDLKGTDVQMQAYLQQYRNMYATIDQYRQKDLISEQDAARLKAQVDADMLNLRLQQTSDFLSAASALQSSNIRQFAAIGKAAAIVQAVINTYEGATKALAQGGIYGTVMAAVVVAQGLAQVAQIRAQQLPGYRTGGEFIVGGHGGPDTTPVQFMATPGEQVSVKTPSQQRASDGSDGENHFHVTMVNVVDPSLVGQYLGTDAGNRVFINKIQANATTVKQIVKGS